MSKKPKSKSVAAKLAKRKVSKSKASKTVLSKINKSIKIPVIEKKISQAHTQAQQELDQVKSALRIEQERSIQKENEWNNLLSAKSAEVIRLENERLQENPLLQSQIEKLQNIEIELLQRLIEKQQEIDGLKIELQSEKGKSATLKTRAEEQNESQKNLEQNLAREEEEKAVHIAKIKTLEDQLQYGNLTIENLLDQKLILESQFQNKKEQIALELARGLGEVLTKLSALAEKEPEPVRGLKPRAVYETLLSWLEKTFGERPKMFPSSKEFTLTSDGKRLINLDADEDGIESLIKRYDWSHERPFENRPEGQRQCQFRILQWGWKVGGTILVRANVTIWRVNQ